MTFNWEIGITQIFGLFGLLGLFVSFRQLVLVQRSNRAKLIIDLSHWFTENAAERSFFYRLDYSSLPSSFKFDPLSFPGSDDEHHLDALLYKLSHIGSMVRHKVIRVSDLGWLRSIVDIVLKNTEVHAYLDWLRTPEQMPDHESFSDAIYLFERLHRGPRDDVSLKALRRYVS